MSAQLSHAKQHNNLPYIPPIGFGTYQLKDQIAYDSVTYALKIGYRHLDEAKLYKNGKYVGQAIVDSGISRDKIHITDKVLNKDAQKGYNRILSEFEKRCKELQTDYIDLLLLHSPIVEMVPENWPALQYLYYHNKCKMIGISNFEIEDMAYFEKNPDVVQPMVNQIEVTPFNTKEKLVDYCKKKNIIIEAHTSLTRGEKLGHPIIVEIAKDNNMTPAQLMLVWARQLDYIVLPRSDIKSQIEENFNLPTKKLSNDDMIRLNNLNENFALTIRRN
jgi:diketogulonate reductase-like aldo/keto reductase